MAGKGISVDPPTGAGNFVTIPVYPYETSTSTGVSMSTLAIRTISGGYRRDVGQDPSKPQLHQKVVHHYKINLEELGPDEPDQEFLLQIAREIPACALSSCGSLKTSHVQGREKKGQYRGWKRLLSAWEEKELRTEDGGPNFLCKFGHVSVDPLDRSSCKRVKVNHSSWDRSSNFSSKGESSDDDEQSQPSSSLSSGSEMGYCTSRQLGSSPKKITPAPVTIMVTVSMERVFSDREWECYRCTQGPEPKSSLLMDADNTGDVCLLTKDGDKVAAHSAVLINVPYFAARLKPHWEDKLRTPSSKLELHLPCPGGKIALRTLLSSVYGDFRPLYRITPADAPVLQEILELADACGVPTLCSEVDRMAVLTSTNLQSWVDWLRQPPGSNIRADFIRQEVAEKVKIDFIAEVEWGDLSGDQLAELLAFRDALKKRSD